MVQGGVRQRRDKAPEMIRRARGRNGTEQRRSAAARGLAAVAAMSLLGQPAGQAQTGTCATTEVPECAAAANSADSTMCGSEAGCIWDQVSSTCTTATVAACAAANIDAATCEAAGACSYTPPTTCSSLVNMSAAVDPNSSVTNAEMVISPARCNGTAGDSSLVCDLKRNTNDTSLCPAGCTYTARTSSSTFEQSNVSLTAVEGARINLNILSRSLTGAFRCSDGYRINTSVTIICDTHGGAALLSGQPCTACPSPSSTTVSACLDCANGGSKGCAAATCATGHHSYDRHNQTCAPCTPIDYAEPNATFSCTSYDDTTFLTGTCTSGYYNASASNSTKAEECVPCSTINMSDATVGTCSNCTGGSEADCVEASCADGFHTYSSQTLTCTACTAVANADPSSIVTCTSEYDSRVSGCEEGYFIVTGNSSVVADECVPCSTINMSDATVGTCSNCTGGSEADCVEASCADGFHTYSSQTLTCTACTAVANADPSSIVTCTSEYDSRVSGCEEGYFIVTGNSSVVADECVPCSTINMSDATVGTCSNCTGGSEADCVEASCADGFHTYSSQTLTCTACTAVANADPSSSVTCTSEYDSRVSGCEEGYFIVTGNSSVVADECVPCSTINMSDATVGTCSNCTGGSEADCVEASCADGFHTYSSQTLTCTACTAVANADPSSSVTCTSEYDSRVSGCEEGYFIVTGNSSVVADECVPCSTINMSDATVGTCSNCTGGSEADCVEASCADGFHTYSSQTLTCTACTAVANADPSSIVTCTSEYDSRVSGCEEGYFIVTGNSSVVADECVPCSTINMSDATVGTCSNCTGGSEADCVEASCADGFHTYSSQTLTCTACTAVANADPSSSVTCTSEYDSRVSGCEEGYFIVTGNSSVVADECVPCSTINMSDATVGTCSNCTGGSEADCVEASCADGFHTYSSQTLTCTACTAVANADPSSIVTCTSEYDSRVSGCEEGYFIVTGNSSVVADECVPCVVNMSDATVGTCSNCTGGSEADCVEASCADGFHTYSSQTLTCTACTAVANADPSSSVTCTSEYDSRVSGCEEGYFIVTGNSSVVADECVPCSTINMSDATVGTCSNCTGGSEADCVEASCADGFHTYSSQTLTCTACTAVANADPSSIVTCTSEYDSRVSGCEEGYFIVTGNSSVVADECVPCSTINMSDATVGTCSNCTGGSEADCVEASCADGFHTYSSQTLTCTACTAVANADPSSIVTCTSEYDSRVSGCEEGYFIVTGNSSVVADECVPCSTINMSDATVGTCSNCTGGSEADCVEASCADGFHTYSSQTLTCTACTAVANADPSSIVTCTSEYDSRVSGCEEGYFIVTGNSSVVADECVPCVVNMSDATVGTCSNCTGGSEADCVEASCADGFHTYSSQTLTCTACTAVANADPSSIVTCTSEYDSRVSGCEEGYFIVTGNSSVVADECVPCSTINMSDATVGTCSNCTGGSEADCVEASCADGFHTYSSQTLTCTACTAVANADPSSIVTCTSEYDSRVSGCDDGFFFVWGAAGADECRPCTEVQNAASNATITCRHANSSHVSGCAAGFFRSSNASVYNGRRRALGVEPRLTTSSVHRVLQGGSAKNASCLVDEYVSSNNCTPCPAGTTRAAGDDPSGADTECNTTYCGVDEYVSSHVCVACPAGTTRAAGDDASLGNTSCSDVVVCTRPDLTSGYTVVEKQLNSDGFKVDVRCAPGFDGVAVATACSSSGPYSLNGCTLADLVMDTCEPCNVFSTEASVVRCRNCTNGAVSGCVEAECAQGFHTYNTSTYSCSPCTPVENSNVNASISCTTEHDTRISATGADGQAAQACADGYFQVNGTDAWSADYCRSCSTVNMSAEPSVASCDLCSSAATSDCHRATCSPGFHSYSSATSSCERCAPVANAAAGANYTCTSEHDSRVSSCSGGHFLSAGLLSSADSCVACVAISHAEPNATYTCTDEYSSRVSGCASGFRHVHHGANASDACVPKQRCTSFDCNAHDMVHIVAANDTLWPSDTQRLDEEICCVFNCIRPLNTTGYNFTGAVESLAAEVGVFDVSGLACAAGFKGVPEALPCDLVHSAGRRVLQQAVEDFATLASHYYSLKGCWPNNASIPCEAPLLSIATPSPLVIRPSTSISVRAIGSLSKCDAPERSGLKFLWTAFTDYGEQIVLDPVATRCNTSQLRLPEYIFSAGRVQLQVESWLSSNRAANTSVAMEVVVEATPYVTALIAGGSFRKVDITSDLFFDASTSEDPDNPSVIWDSVVWSCVNVSMPTAHEACWDGSFSLPKAGSLTWNLTSQLRVSGPGLLRFSVLLVSNGRNDTASVDVEIVAIPIPSVSIVNVQSKYSPSKRVVLQSEASTTAEPNKESGMVPALSYSWIAWRCFDSACDEPEIPFDLLALTSTPLQNQILVVRPNMLQAGDTYRFRLEVHDGVATGVCQVDVLMNVAPKDGTLTVEPAEGLAVTDTFQLTAADWTDEDIPLTYRFFYSVPDQDMGNALSAQKVPLTEASVAATTSSILAVGRESLNYTYTLVVSVSDAFDASTQASTPVVVRPYVPSANIAEDAENLLASAAASDNVQATTQLIGAFAASLNTESESEDGVHEETEADRDARNAEAAATRALLADSLLSVVSSSSEDGAAELNDDVKEAVAEGLKGVTANPEQMTTETLGSSLAAVSMLADSGSGPTAAAVDSLAEATSNLVVALAAQKILVVADESAGEQLTEEERRAQEQDQKAQEEEFAQATLNVVEALSKALVSDAMPGEEPTSVSTDSFDISSQKNFAGAFAGAPLPIGAVNRRRFLADGVDIVVPDGVFDNTDVSSESAVDAMVTAWAANPYSFADTSNLTASFDGEDNVRDDTRQEPLSMGSSVLGLSFAADGDEIGIHDLEEPFVMSLAPNTGLNDSALIVYCSHWNTTLKEWVVDTRFGPGNITDGGIVCQFDHLTDFSAFVGPPPNFNKPCFSCLDQLWSNPAGLLVTITCGGILIFVFIVGIVRYVHFSRYTPKEILAMKFTEERRKVMSPDEDYMSSCSEDVAHRIRHDYSCGGILCQIPGDPFDWSQRFLVFHTTLIMSLFVSLLLFRPPAEGECVEQCTQMDPEGPRVCETVCNEPEKNGIYVSVVSALISTPIVVGLGYLFAWLRKPVVGAIEPDTVSVTDAIKVVLCCFDTKKTSLGSKFVEKMEQGVKYVTDADDEKETRAAGGRNRSSNVLIVDASAFTVDSDSSDDEEKLNPPPTPMTMAELRIEVARAQSRWRQQEHGARALPAFLTPGSVPEDDGKGFRDLATVPHEQEDNKTIRQTAAGDVGEQQTEQEGHLPIPWLDGASPTGDDSAEPKPRAWYFAMLPFLYALIFGVGGLVMIASIAAGLGAKNTKAWLISALMSLVLKVFFVDPVKVCALTAFIQFAEDYNRETLAKALENKAKSLAVSAAATSKQGMNAVGDTYRTGVGAKDKILGSATAGAAGLVAVGAAAASAAMDKADFTR